VTIVRRFGTYAALALLAGGAEAQDAARYEYRLLATNRVSTMERELNDAASRGFVFAGFQGGETAFGGREVVAVLTRDADQPRWGRFDYVLLATSRTGTLERELNHFAAAGFVHRSQAAFETEFGGHELLVVMERDLTGESELDEYLVLATHRTSTMQDELARAGRRGWAFRGVSVARTFAGQEVVSVLARPLRW
jgi:hypothetical protein